MAEVIAAIGLPHTPAFPALAAQQGPDCEVVRPFAVIRNHLADLKPEVLVVFSTDHLNTMFFDNLPIFAVGVADDFTGPNDEIPHLPARRMPSHAGLAQHIRTHAVRSDFDAALVQEFALDHSFVVPLHFVTPKHDVPVVPVFLSGHVPPLPSAARCFALGGAVRAAIEAFPDPLRVVVIGSGSFSLDVYGPRIAPGRNFGVPDPAWAARVEMLLRRGETQTLIVEATHDQLLHAGNVGGELLNWIAMLGTWPAHKPVWFASQPGFGHGYGIWR